MDTPEIESPTHTRLETMSNSSWTFVDDGTSSERSEGGSDDFDLISHNGEDEVVIEGECGATEEEEGDEENVEDDEDDEDNVMVEFVHDDGFDVDELIDQIISSSESEDDKPTTSIDDTDLFDLIDGYVDSPNNEDEVIEDEVAAKDEVVNDEVPKNELVAVQSVEDIQVVSLVERDGEGNVVEEEEEIVEENRVAEVSNGVRIPGDLKDLASELVFDHEFAHRVTSEPALPNISDDGMSWSKTTMESRVMYLLSSEKRQRRKMRNVMAVCGVGVLVIGYLCSAVSALHSEVGQLQTQIDQLKMKLDSNRMYKSDVARYELSNAILQTSVDSVLGQQRELEEAVLNSEARIDSLSTQLTDVNTTCHLLKDTNEFIYSLGEEYSHVKKLVSDFEGDLVDRFFSGSRFFGGYSE